MSSQGNLFVPRKQNIAGAVGHSTWVDPQHLQQALLENFLAIQNWANRRATSCSVRGSTAETVTNNSNQQLSFDTKTWDYSNIASTSAQTIKIPEPGIYIVSAGVAVTHIPGQTQMGLSMNPGGYPAQNGLLLGTTDGGWTMSFGGNAQRFRQSQVGTALTVNFNATMPSSSATCSAVLKEFTTTKREKQV